jgi:hypothetical protein
MVMLTNTMVLMTYTMVFATKTIFPVNRKMVADFVAMVFVSYPKASDTSAMVFKTNPMVNASNTMVFDADQVIEYIKLIATVDFYHGIWSFDHGV